MICYDRSLLDDSQLVRSTKRFAGDLQSDLTDIYNKINTCSG